MSDDSTEQKNPKSLPPKSRFVLLVLGAICLLVPVGSALAGDSPFLSCLSLFPVACVLLPVMWFGAELNDWGKWWRILLGLGSLVCVGLVIHWFGRVALSHETTRHQAGMEELGRLLEDDREETVREGVRKYNQVVAEGGTPAAATQAMLECLDACINPKD